MAKRSKSPMKAIQRGQSRQMSSLSSISAVLEQQSETLKQIQTGSQAVEDQNENDHKSLMAIKIQQAQLDLQKDQLAFLKKISDNSNKQIDALVKQNKDWKGFGDKFKDLKQNLSDALDPNTIKKALLGPFSMFKGARNKMEDLDYIKRMKAMGDTRSNKDLRAAAKDSREKKEAVLRTDDQYQRMKKAGATDDDIRQSNPDFWAKRMGQMKDYNQSRVAQTASSKPPTPNGNFSGDQPSAPLPQTPSDKGQVSQSTTDLLADQQAAHENQVEMLRLTGAQADLLQQIATNTALMAGKRSSSAGGAEDAGQSAAAAGGGGGFIRALSGIGDAMGKLGGGLRGLGKGIGDAIGGVFAGIMGGISDGIKAFASAKTLAGVAVLGLITAVVWGMSEALQKFADIDWDTIAKAGVVLVGLIAAGAGAGAIAPLLGLGALALAGLGASIWVIGEAMQNMGDGLEAFTSGLERLQDIDSGAIVSLAGAMALLGGAFAAFGAGQAAAGLGSLISNLLTVGQDSPVDQLIKIGTAGPGVKDAADGMGKMADTMKQFGSIDPNTMKTVKEFPWAEATKFVAAGGAMKMAGATVYNSSKGNADEQAKVDGSKGGGAIVNAPTQNVSNNNQTNVIKPPVRNTESSYNRYLMSRF